MRQWDLRNKPACPTTWSHCWGFLGVMGKRDEVLELLCLSHSEFWIRMMKKKAKNPKCHYIAQTHPPAGVSAVCGFRCFNRQTAGNSDFRLQSLDFTPDGRTMSPWKQHYNTPKWRHTVDMVSSQLRQTFTRSTCFQRDPLTKQTSKF